MKVYRFYGASVVAAAIAFAQNPAPAPQTTPAWAYAVNPPPVAGAQPARDDGSPKHVPGSTLALTLPQIRDLFNPPDWHPDNHAAMPEIVSHGRRPDVRACGYCHLPNGQGRPENASLAARRLHLATDGGLQSRPAQERRAAHGATLVDVDHREECQ
jgi:hypothetical protein